MLAQVASMVPLVVILGMVDFKHGFLSMLTRYAIKKDAW